jgi:hypothetical protein
MALGFCLLMPCQAQTGALPARKTRAESSFGLHFDFHASAADKEIGKTLTRKMIDSLLTTVQPDFIQIDCKGHAGFSSYPTKVGNHPGGFVQDPLKLFREVTAERGVALYLHYSGVLDGRAAELHPGWAAKNANGVSSPREISRHSGYLDELLIPQLKEIADYGADGAWIDGENWAVQWDYSEKSLADFTNRTGIEKAPLKPEEPGWREWTQFTRGAFKNYLRTYVDAIHAYKPSFQIASNWAYSGYMPEPVDVNVDFLSGDIASSSGVYSAAFEARCLAPQGKPWDLMAWSFRYDFKDSFGSPKNPQAVMQEAAQVISQGGGFQVYYNQNNDASLRPWQFQGMAEIAGFCRARQPFAVAAKPVPQVAVLYSSHGFYHDSGFIYDHNAEILNETKGVMMSLLDRQYSVQILHEHHLRGRMKDFPAIVIPGWRELEASFKSELLEYVTAGGNLLLTGADAIEGFKEGIGLKGFKRRGEESLNLGHEGRFCGLKSSSIEAEIPPDARVMATFHKAPDFASESRPAAVVLAHGKGKIGMVFANVGSSYIGRRTRLGADFLSDVLGQLMRPAVRVTGSSYVHVNLTAREDQTLIHLMNVSGHHDHPQVYEWAEVAPLCDLAVEYRCDKRPLKLTLQPAGEDLVFNYKDGVVAFNIPKLEIHAIIQVDEMKQ